MIPIQPTLAGFPPQEATTIVISPLTHATTDGRCKVHWQLFNELQEPLHEGNVDIDNDDYTQWDSTNESLENIVLTKLNIERDGEN